jgi:Ssp1 endopeptidase immunity protein Rap1a
MKLSRVMLAVTCIAMLSATRHAQDKPDLLIANNVTKGCRAQIAQTNPDTEANWFLRGICIGMVTALSRTAFSLEPLGVGAMGICMPSSGAVTADQQMRIIVAYIDARPNRLHEDFNKLAWEALIDAWPCKR